MVKTLIVDDELKARENLAILLEAYEPTTFDITYAENADEAKRLITKNKPELLFLDIEMPNKNGFQLINELKEIDFPIIFVTAYDHYAIKAFEVSAFDYLLKPLDIERLYLSLGRVLNLSDKNTVFKRLKALQENEAEGKITKIAIPERGDYILLDTKEIICIEANRAYVEIYTEKSKYIYAKPLKYFEDVLTENSQFIRVHRSWIINTNFVEKYSKRDAEILMKNQLKISVSRSYKEELLKSIQ